MSGHKKCRHAPSATPWSTMNPNDLTPAQALVKASHDSIYAFRHEPFAGDADFFNGYVRSTCPRCGSAEISKSGHDRNGVQRYRCARCRKTFTPITGTIFEDHRLPLTAWADFVLQAISFESIAAMTREDRRATTTSPYWLAKLFAVLNGIQDDVVLSGNVQIDEKYYPLALKDQVLPPDKKKLRGLSKNQICIAVGWCSEGVSYFSRMGFGKPSKSRVWDVYGSHIKRGSKIDHDMEGSHDILIDRLNLNSTVHNSKHIKLFPDNENPLHEVNRLCFLLELFLNSHSGFDRNDLDGYLNLFWVAMNPPDDKLEKVAMVLDRAMRYPNTLRFREFYNVHSRSDG